MSRRPSGPFGNMPFTARRTTFSGDHARQVLERLAPQPTGVPRMAVVALVGGLAWSDVELRRVDDDDVIASVDMRGKRRLVLPAQQRGGLGRDPAQHRAIGVDDVPGSVRCRKAWG